MSFRDFGPSAINISMTITGTNGPNGMQGQSSIQINPFGYYMGQVTSTVSNVTTTSNTVSFYTAITNTTSLEVAGVPIGSITQTMGANVTYNSDSGQMSFKITSSQAYK